MSGPFGAGALQFFSGGADFYPHTINQSLRFENSDASYLSRTHTAGNRQTFTLSVWFKRSDIGSSGSKYFLHTSTSGSAAGAYLYMTSTGTLTYYDTSTTICTTTEVFRDDAAWYNIIFAVDFTQSTGSNRVKIYVNGTQQTVTFTDDKSTSFNSYFNSNITHYISTTPAANAMDGYLAEMNFIDGQQLTPSSFGETKEGIWIPKDTSDLTFGTNGFRLTFEGTGTGTTSQGTTAQTNIGDDQSGGGHNWAVTSIVSTDVVLDSPTNNFCTYSSLDRNAFNNSFISQGNLNVADYVSSAALTIGGTMSMRSGKWYFEILRKAAVNGGYWGIIREDKFAGQSSTGATGTSSGDYAYYVQFNGSLIKNGSTTSSFLTAFSTDDIIQVAYDADTGKVWFGRNNTWGGSGDPANGTNEAGTVDSYSNYGYKVWTSVIGNAFSYEQASLNCGQDSSFAGEITAGGNADGNGIGDFKYAPPSGFLALCTANLPNPGIDPAAGDKPEDYFNTKLFTGNAGTQSITGVGFQPQWLWIKRRDSSPTEHALFDIVRGAGKSLKSNTTTAEQTQTDSVTSLDSDGFSLGDNTEAGPDVNYTSGGSYVAWNWLAGGSASSNSDGSITSSVSANTEAGFSIVTWTGTGSNATVGHGLGVAPSVIIGKVRSRTDNWIVGHHEISSSPWNNTVFLNVTDSIYTNAAYWNNTAPTSSVFTTGTWWYGSEDYVAYCFHSVDGYSKVGSYTGNGSSDGTFIYTGFRPAWILQKRTDSADSWHILDNKRVGYNPNNWRLYPNVANAETTAGVRADFLSNGFKLLDSNGDWNASGGTYIYLAFADQPFKYANAR